MDGLCAFCPTSFLSPSSHTLNKDKKQKHNLNKTSEKQSFPLSLPRDPFEAKTSLPPRFGLRKSVAPGSLRYEGLESTLVD